MLFWKLATDLKKPAQALAQLSRWAQFSARLHQLPDASYELLVPIGRRPQSVLTALQRFDADANWEQVDLYEPQPDG